MRGQAQAVTAVLITGVVVGSIGASYVWGVPLLEKQQSQADLDQAEENIVGLYDKIIEVSRSGEGTTSQYSLTEDISSQDNMRVQINTEQNYIDFRIRSSNPPYPTDTWTLIRGNSFQNLSTGSGEYAVEGSDLPGAVAVRPVGAPDSSLITYRVEFRNLLVQNPSGRQLNRVNLTVPGQKTATGESQLYISNQGTKWERGSNRVELSSGELIPRKNTLIRISVQ